MDTPVSEDLHEDIRLNSFGVKTHTLVLNAKELILDDAHFSLSAITHLKFGVKIRQFGMFPVGRKYQISLKTPAKKLDLVFNCYFGFRSKYFLDLYEQLVNSLWLKIGDRLLAEALDLIKAGGAFTIGNCAVSKAGVTLKYPATLTKSQSLIPWNDLRYEKKYDRLVLNSKSNQRLWLNLYFIEDWNVDVLMDLLDWLYTENGLAELTQNSSPQT